MVNRNLPGHEADLEPACWWTKEERERCRRNLIIDGPHREWFGWGREYWQVTSLPSDNIYGEGFSWREYQNPNLPA